MPFLKSGLSLKETLVPCGKIMRGPLADSIELFRLSKKLKLSLYHLIVLINDSLNLDLGYQFKSFLIF